jgi:hypothetical protein
MLETIIVILIIAVAAAYVAWNFYRKYRAGRQQDTGGACSGCGSQGSCQHQTPFETPSETCPGKDSS